MKASFLLNNRPEEWEQNLTIASLLKKKSYSFPMLVVRINGKIIKKGDYAETIIPENAEVIILHLMSGG